MENQRPKRWFRTISTLLIAACVLVVVLSFRAFTDYAYVCENTASRKGHRQWFLGLRTGAWYYQSPIETFMQQTHPDKLEHRWMSYAGTGKNIFGQSMSFGHGKSPLSQLRFARDFESYIATLSPEMRLELYHTFSTGDYAAVQAAVDEIVEGSWAITLDQR